MYLEQGALLADVVVDMLPPDWTFDGKRVLDLGAGAGRVARHFVERAPNVASFVAADIHGPSIEWLAAHLRPPFRAVQTDELPPLPLADESFDLVYAFSLFTHLADTWWAWLRELRRVTRPGSHIVLSVLGRGPFEAQFGPPHDGEELGFVALSRGAAWELGGPVVYHGEWWIREVWGALFDVERFVDGGLGQSIVVLRTPDRAVPASPPRLPPEREAATLRLNLRLVSDEALRLSTLVDELRATRTFRYTQPLRALYAATRSRWRPSKSS